MIMTAFTKQNLVVSGDYVFYQPPAKLTFKPIKLETVVVMRGDKVAGTIKRYRAHKGCIVRVPGLLTPDTHPGGCFFPTIAAAKARLIELDTPHD
jgi:hypothetical protein